MKSVLSNYWFPSIIAKRLLGALSKQASFNGITISFSTHEDGDKTMLEMHFHRGSDDEINVVRKMIYAFVCGFEAAHSSTVAAVLPQYVEGRSGNRLDQMNRKYRPDNDLARRHNSVVSLPNSASVGDAEAARNAAYDGIQQFCFLNGFTYPENKE